MNGFRATKREKEKTESPLDQHTTEEMQEGAPGWGRCRALQNRLGAPSSQRQSARRGGKKLQQEAGLGILGAKVSRRDSETDTGSAHPPSILLPPGNSAPRSSPALRPMRAFLLAPGLLCWPAPLLRESIFAPWAPRASPSQSSGNLTPNRSKLRGASLGVRGVQPPPPRTWRERNNKCHIVSRLQSCYCFAFPRLSEKPVLGRGWLHFCSVGKDLVLGGG